MKKPSGLSAEDRICFPWGAVSCSVGGKGTGELKPPLKMKQLQTNLINCVEPVKGQGAITAGNASARLKHWQQESEGRGRDEPFRQAWLHAGEPSHPWVRRVCLSGRSSCLSGPASVQQAARMYWCQPAAIVAERNQTSLLSLCTCSVHSCIRPSVQSRWRNRLDGGSWGELGWHWSCFEPDLCFLSYPCLMLLEE